MSAEAPPRTELKGSRLLARPYRGADGAELFEAASESVEQMYPFMPWCHPGYTLDESQAWTSERPSRWAERTEFDFALRTLEDGRFVGGCGLNCINQANRFANLGYWIRASATNQGFATEAVRLMVEFGFRRLELHRLEIVIAFDNTASMRVAEKAGARREGILRSRLRLHGRSVDAVMFSVVREGP